MTNNTSEMSTSTPLRVLMIEDSEDDALLILRALKKGGYDPQSSRVETAEDMLRELQKTPWDIILCDYLMPRFSSIDAISVLKTTKLDIPLIIVSGVIGEETAVDCMHYGASDFVMKGNLARLCPAIDRELKEKAQRIGRKQAEQKQHESEFRFKALFENMSSPVAIYEAVSTDGGNDFVFTGFNKAAEKTEKVNRKDLLGQSVREVFPGIMKMGLWDVLQRVWRTGMPERLPASYYQDDHRQGWKEHYVYKLPTGEVVALYDDITERRKAQEALKKSEETFSKVFKSNPAAIIISRMSDGLMLDVNKSLEKLLGYTREEIIGRTSLELKVWPDAAERRKVTDFIAENRTIMDREIHLQSKNGQKLVALYSAELIELDGESCLLSILMDITENKNAETERQKLEKQLFEAQKMEAIGTLAGGVAHDFNNILGAIIGYSEMALRETDDQIRKKNIEHILVAAERARKLAHQILSFSRHAELDREPIDLGSIVKEALNLLRSTIPTTIEILQNTSKEALTINADSTQMHQVIMNICTNAVHAMGERGGVLTIDLTREDIAADAMAAGLNLKPGPYVNLSIADTGHGIDASIIDRIFDPFFTTKAIGVGTGLGLSVVYGIARKHRGTVTVSSKPGEKTTFNVYLPLIEPVAPAEDFHDSKLISGGREHILFVDDEKELVNIYSKNLSALGYKVTSCSDSREALKTYLDHPGEFDLVITDMTMPYMSGNDLAREMLRLNPKQPIILCTGYSTYVNTQKAAEIGINTFMLKPFSIKSLALAIRKTLDKQEQ